MAERRMFTQKITEADEFTSLPPTTQCLYFHLCMSADDDGFSNKIRQSLFNSHADNNDFDLLVQKRFIIPFDSGVVVIKHWRMHNLIRSDRYHATDYLEEKSTLLLKKNGVYTEQCNSIGNQVTTKWQPSDNQMEPEVRLGKDSIGKVNKELLDKSNNSLSSKLDCDTEVYKEIIDYLNQKTGKKFRWQTKSTQEKINGRISDGFNVEDFKKVIDNKCADWKDNPKMNKFLRPETLFIPGHFESYLNETGEKDTKEWQDEQEKWFLEGSK